LLSQRERANPFGFYEWIYASNYVNIVGRNNAKGVETMVAYLFSSALKVNANYTFTQVEEPLAD
jgi:vitamin B12 transporter